MHPCWTDFLAWLAAKGALNTILVQPRISIAGGGTGYGLFAVDPIPPSAPLFTVPANALINVLTLAPHYPPAHPMLSAVQMISLHLFLHRPLGSQKPSSDPIFGPYISLLPRQFDSHPLTWLWKRDSGSLTSQNIETELLASLPPSIMHSLKQLSDRFHADWRTILQYLQRNLDALSYPRSTALASTLQSENKNLEMDYLWAWLNVNTRCIYHRLRSSRSDPDNMTLCPILDFANHTTQPPHMSPLLSDAATRDTSPRSKTGDDFTLLAPAGVTTQRGDELYLTYGAHSNKTLFVEYGFVNQTSEESRELGGEVDLQVIMERLFEERGKLGTWMKEQLMDKGYWGNWALYSFPVPAHPSYRLITALRLYRLLPISMTRVPLNPDSVLQPWWDTLLGERESVSEDNERYWRETLIGICEGVVEAAASATAGQQGCKSSSKLDKEDWATVMKDSIRTLWEEELYVATAVSESTHAGVQF